MLNKETVVISAIFNIFETLNVKNSSQFLQHLRVYSWTTVSMRFPLTVVISCNVWIVQATHEWLSQVTNLSAMNIPAKRNWHPIHEQLIEIEWHLRVILLSSHILFSLLRHFINTSAITILNKFILVQQCNYIY